MLIYTMLEHNKKNSAEDVSDDHAIDAFVLELHHSDFVEEMGRTKPKTVSELMDVANKFANGEDAYYNKRTRSPEDDRSHRYNNQRCRSHNYENYNSHNQVAAGYKGNNNEGEEHRSNRYHNRDDSGSHRQFRPRNFDPSPKDILNEPCHMHYAYVDGKRVFNHLMRNCRTFLKLQEAIGSKQAGTPGSIEYGAPPPPPLLSHGDVATQGQPNLGSQGNGGYIQSKGHIVMMIQLVPKSKKEQKSISRQVNLAITSPPATAEYLNWSNQTVGFIKAVHPRKVPCPGHTPMVLKSQNGGYDVGRVFMDAGCRINLIYAQTLRAMNIPSNFCSQQTVLFIE
jgi:hypothetical protein